MTRIIRNVILVVILAAILILLQGAVLDWVGKGSDDRPGYVVVGAQFARDVAAFLLIVSVVWLWRRYQSHRSANGKDGSAR